MASWRDAPVVEQGQQAGAQGGAAWQSAPVVEQGQQQAAQPAQPRPANRPQPPPATMVNATRPQVTEGVPTTRPQVTEGPAPTLRETPRTMREGARLVGDAAIGTGEVAGTLATGGASEVVAGLAGIETLLGGGTPEEAAQRVEEVQRLRTYQPRTEMGQRILQGAGVPFQALGEAAERAGGATLEATGSPGAATAVHTAVEAAPGLLGARGGRPGFMERRRDVRGVREGARELGVDMNAGVTPQRQQIEAAGERLAAGGRTGARGQPSVPPAGAGLPDVQAGLQQRADQARQWKNSLYDQAKQGDAAVDLDTAVGLADRLQSVRQDFLTEDMPAANRLLGEVEQLRRIQKRRNDLVNKGGQPKDIAVTINQMEEWGQKVRRNQPDQRSDPAQHAAMERMIRTKDEFMDELFNADMISGDTDAIQAWRRAREANRSYRERFSDDKVIRDMVEMEATPETLRKWIFGANAAGAKTEAASVVQRIKSELGEDSPEFTALRQEAVLDILDPLLGPDPNLKGFIRRYDQFVDRRSSLSQELFGENLKGLTDLRNLAQAHRDRPTVALSELPGAARMLSVAAFGHQMAQKALTVRAGSTAATLLARTTTPEPRRRMMADILGYDPHAPTFGTGTAAILGATQELANPPQESPERGSPTQSAPSRVQQRFQGMGLGP